MTPSFVPDVDGNYTITLVVNDGEDDSNNLATVDVISSTVEVEKVALYIASTSSTSSYNEIIGQWLDGSTVGIIKYVPSAASAMEIFKFNNNAWSSNIFPKPYTVDGQLFVVLGNWDAFKFDPDTGETQRDIRIFDQPRTGCVAVVGNHVYYQDGFSSDIWGNVSGGFFKKYSLLDGTKEVFEDTDLCGLPTFGVGNMQSAGGALYNTDVNLTTGVISIDSHSLVDGVRTTLRQLTGNVSEYYYSFAFDENQVVYILEKSKDGGLNTLFYYDIATDNLVAVLEYQSSLLNAVGASTLFDAHKGHVAISHAGDNLLLYNCDTNTYEILDIGGTHYSLQIQVRP